jgi:hypothetical protein
LFNGAAELILVDAAVGAADLPAAKADRRGSEPGLSKLPAFHAAPVRRGGAIAIAAAGQRSSRSVPAS